MRDRAIIEVLWGTGLCRGELLRMETFHVDLDAATVLVPLTKTKRPRVVPLSDRTLDALAGWLEARLSWHPDLDAAWLSKYRGQAVAMTRCD